MGEKQKEWRDRQKYTTKFSVIIPMKDTEKHIMDALNSVKAQNYNNCEILVINDHSRDSSKEIVEK